MDNLPRRSSSSMSFNTNNPFRLLIAQQEVVLSVAPAAASDESHHDWKQAVALYKRADDAQAALPALKQYLKDAEDELAQAEATLQALKQQNASTYKTIHAPPKEKKGLPSLKSLIPGKSKGRTDAPASGSIGDEQQLPRRDTQREFNASYLAEANALSAVERRNVVVGELKAQFAGQEQLASTVTAAFHSVRDVAELLFTPIVVGRSAQLKQARQNLEAEDEAVDRAHRVATDMGRARAAAQTSHKYLMVVLNRSDEARDPKKQAIGAFGPMSQVDVLNKFNDAVEKAAISQKCLDECLILLRRHSAHVPGKMESYIEKLADDGVSQVQRMHNILYGGGATFRGAAREKQLEILDAGQKIAFEYLTKVAVWLQEFVPVLEKEQEAAAERRRSARRILVDLWDAALRSEAAQRMSWTGPGSADSHTYPPARPSDVSIHSLTSNESLEGPKWQRPRPSGPRNPAPRGPLPSLPPVAMINRNL